MMAAYRWLNEVTCNRFHIVDCPWHPQGQPSRRESSYFCPGMTMQPAEHAGSAAVIETIDWFQHLPKIFGRQNSLCWVSFRSAVASRHLVVSDSTFIFYLNRQLYADANRKIPFTPNSRWPMQSLQWDDAFGLRVSGVVVLNQSPHYVIQRPHR